MLIWSMYCYVNLFHEINFIIIIITLSLPPSECAGCHDDLLEGQALIALDRQWHIWCFKCAACSTLLHGEYMGKWVHFNNFFFFLNFYFLFYFLFFFILFLFIYFFFHFFIFIFYFYFFIFWGTLFLRKLYLKNFNI